MDDDTARKPFAGLVYARLAFAKRETAAPRCRALSFASAISSAVRGRYSRHGCSGTTVDAPRRRIAA